MLAVSLSVGWLADVKLPEGNELLVWAAVAGAFALLATLAEAHRMHEEAGARLRELVRGDPRREEILRLIEDGQALRDRLLTKWEDGHRTSTEAWRLRAHHFVGERMGWVYLQALTALDPISEALSGGEDGQRDNPQRECAQRINTYIGKLAKWHELLGDDALLR